MLCIPFRVVFLDHVGARVGKFCEMTAVLGRETRRLCSAGLEQRTPGVYLSDAIFLAKR
jgi:hypothetical protein